MSGVVMPKEADRPAAVEIMDTISLGQFAVVFPQSAVQRALKKWDRETERNRALPNVYIVYFVMMLGLMRGLSNLHVFQRVAETLSYVFGKRTKFTTPSAAALSKARSRVGFEPLQTLFDECCVPLAKSTDTWAHYKGMRLFGIDGTTKAVEDTPANSKFFGRSKNQNQSQGLFPQLRAVGIVELGTHAWVGLEIGRYLDSEITLSKELIPKMVEGSLYLADRLFYSYDLFKSCLDKGVQLLVRVKLDINFHLFQRLPDKSYLAYAYHSEDRKRESPVIVRVIDYKVRKSGKKHIRLVTTLLDWKTAPADELANQYRQRWEFETAIDEVKTHLDLGSNTLRSRTPTLVKQEVLGLAMTHYVTRTTMYQAADKENLDPDDLSYTHAVEVIRCQLPFVAASPPLEITSTTSLSEFLNNE
jgi:hypothetical protein